MSPFLQTAIPIVEGLVAIAFPGAAAILADLNALVAGVTSKNETQIVGAATTLLNDATTQGVIGGTLIDEAAKDLGLVEAFVADVKGNQVAIIRGNTSLFGVKGVYAFIPSASDQGQSLGL